MYSHLFQTIAVSRVVCWYAVSVVQISFVYHLSYCISEMFRGVNIRVVMSLVSITVLVRDFKW
jgi:hypothetical protein